MDSYSNLNKKVYGSGSGGDTWYVEHRTISSAEETAKALTLVNTPTGTDAIMIGVVGGTAQEYGVDYTLSTATVSWNGLGLDGVLAENDVLVIAYAY